MLDEPLEEILEFISQHSYRNVIAPGFINSAISKNTPASNVQSYIINIEDIGTFDIIVIHKGLLHRIDRKVLIYSYLNWSLVYANSVYCIYSSKTIRNLDIEQLIEHSGPIDDFISTIHINHQPVSNPKSAVIVSAFGVHNVGDDLVSIASERMLLDAGFNSVTKSGPDVSLEELEQHDLIALGGGGLLYDTDAENLENYLYPLRLGTALGKKTAVLGVGTQGFKSTLGKKCTARILKDVNFVSVRSPQDRDIIQRLDPSSGADAFSGQDMAFFLADDLRGRAIAPVSTAKIVLFSLSIQIKNRLSKIGISIDSACDSIIQKLQDDGYHVLLALHSLDDLKFYRKLSRRNNVNLLDLSRIGIYGTASAYACASLVVTSRFHALIYGAIFRKSIISVYSNDSKNGRLLKSYLTSLLPQSEELSNFSVQSICEKIDRATPVDQSEVEACEDAARSMQDHLRNAIAA